MSKIEENKDAFTNLRKKLTLIHGMMLQCIFESTHKQNINDKLIQFIQVTS